MNRERVTAPSWFALVFLLLVYLFLCTAVGRPACFLFCLFVFILFAVYSLLSGKFCTGRIFLTRLV